MIFKSKQQTMQKIKGYNRNLVGGKRPHRKISKYGKYWVSSMEERFAAEQKALEDYQKRVGQFKRNESNK